MRRQLFMNPRPIYEIYPAHTRTHSRFGHLSFAILRVHESISCCCFWPKKQLLMGLNLHFTFVDAFIYICSTCKRRHRGNPYRSGAVAEGRLPHDCNNATVVDDATLSREKSLKKIAEKRAARKWGGVRGGKTNSAKV